MPSTHAHQTFKRFTPSGAPAFDQCIHIWGRTGCRCENKPEKDSQYCRGCRDFLITLTDRVPPTATVEEKHSWRKPMKL